MLKDLVMKNVGIQCVNSFVSFTPCETGPSVNDPRSCYYRPQTKFAKVMFLQVSVCPQGGRAWLWRACMVVGGVYGCRGVCGCGGACMVKGSMLGEGGCAWQKGGHA